MTVYIAARDLAGLPIGTHQFIIVENVENPYPPAKLGSDTIYAKNLGGGKTGYVVGAQNRGNLAVEYFEPGDYQAAQEYYDPSKRGFWSDFDTEVIAVKFPGINLALAVRRLFTLIDNYHINQTMDRIKYPTAGMGFNSNSWAQTVIELAGGKVTSNMSGLDISHEKRIPRTYFEAVCPVVRRPKVN